MNFPHYQQKHGMSCGMATLCMVAHWVTGRRQRETVWRDKTSWRKERGLLPAGMHRALQMLSRENAVKIERVSSNQIDPYLTASGSTIYVLLIDWYVHGLGRRIKNPRHWIVVHGVHTPRRNKPVVVYENSLKPGGPDLWVWGSLEPIVVAAFAITRLPS